uniref:LITAF domain-containing protein n=1 Tax=Ditylenchus dipsaci TaxID=166011 RepID=A0A915DUK6_9BILA
MWLVQAQAGVCQDRLQQQQTVNSPLLQWERKSAQIMSWRLVMDRAQRKIVSTCLGNRWQCDQNVCLIQESLLNQVQLGHFSWTAQNYSKFWGRTLEDGINYRLGTLFPEKSVENMNEIFIKHRELPISFDAREQWPQLKEFSPPDQGDCGSSWAFSTTQVAVDRLAILSKGALKVELSVQQLLDCNQHKQKGCQGGFLDRAWWYFRKMGLVSIDCYPYTSGESLCAWLQQHNIQNDTPYRISNREKDIQTEIMTNGPVQATFLVHPDFFMYSGGVYRKLHNVDGHSSSAYHSVKILGWGEELGDNDQIQKYWVCSNSWGKDWGERGLFRIVRGENHCQIESFVRIYHQLYHFVFHLIPKLSNKMPSERAAKSIPIPIHRSASYSPSMMVNSKKYLSDRPQLLDCPRCKHHGETELTYVAGLFTWVSFLVILIAGVFILPLFFLWDVEHRCENCRAWIGTYRRIGKSV